MSKRRNLNRRAKKRLNNAAEKLVQNLTPEQQDELVKVLAKAVIADAQTRDTVSGQTAGK
jgi:hypothetical protein